MKNNTKITASGFIIFRNYNNHPQVLGLVALPKHRKRSKGKYDVPKGRIDEGETAFEAAKRECFEESGLTDLRLISANAITKGPMSLWVAEVQPEEDIILSKNPFTGEVEHESYEWLSIKDIKKNCLNYLRPFIVEAEPIIWNYFKIWDRR